MSITEIRRFKDDAFDILTAALIGLDSKTTKMEDVIALAYDPQYTEVVVSNVEIPTGPFKSKFDLGKAIVDNVSEVDMRRLLADENVWPWLSIAFNESIFYNSRGLFVGKLSRHIVSSVGGRATKSSHRQLTRGAALTIFRFGDLAKAFLSNASEHTKIEEQIMSRKEAKSNSLAGSQEIAKTVYALYYDEEKGVSRRGAKGQGAGSIMRFVNILDQLDHNYDISSMTSEEIIAVLPKKEFSRYLPKKTKLAVAA